MKIGTRVIYESESKNIVTILYPMEGSVLERSTESLEFIDIPFDDFDPITQRITGINENGEPNIEPIAPVETEEQRRIRELEDALLLQTDNEIGGIL